MKKVITMTAWRRPDYTLRVIDALKNCIGFEDYLILPTIEPGYPAVSRIFENLLISSGFDYTKIMTNRNTMLISAKNRYID